MDRNRWNEALEERVSRYLDGEMDETETIAFEAELDRDPEVRSILAGFESVDVLARGALAQVVDRPARSARPMSRLRRTPKLMLAAAWVVVGLGVGIALQFSGLFGERAMEVDRSAGSDTPASETPGSETLAGRGERPSPPAGERVRAAVVPRSVDADPGVTDVGSDVLSPGVEDNLRSMVRDALHESSRARVFTERKLYGAVGENDEIYLFEVERSRTIQPASFDPQ